MGPHLLFATFDDTALASASLAQVHKATTEQGETVAVKVSKNNYIIPKL